MPRKKKEQKPVKITGKTTVVDYSEEMQQSYIDYAMSVITDRALPDVRDGLKPVHRRIIYAMADKGMFHNKPYNKCAEIVGEVLGYYHSHGDSSVYEALVRLAQDFSLRYPLIQGHGNLGSIDGDPFAAYRYTEARLQQITDEMVDGLKYHTVKMEPSFNEKKNEPVVLPATFPNLLVNGVVGIAVGMMTNIPTHNMKDSINTVIHAIDNPGASVRDLLGILKGPDFPTGGVICNKNDLNKIYEEGVGNITIRGKHTIEQIGNKQAIVITEIPYTLSGKKEAFFESIIKLAHDKRELQITAVRDESSKEGIRIVIEVKKDMDIDTVVSYLYKFTAYEDTYKYSFLCLEDGKPVTMSLVRYVDSFINFQKEIYSKKYRYMYDKNLVEIEKQKGLLVAYDHIDQIVAIVRNAEKDDDMRLALMTGNTANISGITAKDKKIISKFAFTEIQAEIILETKLRALSKLKVNEIADKIAKIEKENKRLAAILKSDKKLLEDIKANLIAIRDKYGDSRRTQITSAKFDFKEIVEEYNLVIDENNYAKRVKLPTGQSGIAADDKVCVMTDTGDAYLITVKDIPVGMAKDKGIALENFIEGGNIILSFIPSVDSTILLVDSDNYGKKVDCKEFILSRKHLKTYLKNSKIVFGAVLKDEAKLKFVGDNGKTKECPLSKVPVLSRTAKGNKVVQGNFKITSVELV